MDVEQIAPKLYREQIINEQVFQPFRVIPKIIRGEIGRTGFRSLLLIQYTI